MLKRIAAQPLAALLIVYIVVASAYSLITPPWEASDEQWHYPMVKTLADNRLALPVQVPGQVTAWRQEGSQPPLYYMMGAVLTFWIDTSDIDTARWINPHADIGVIVPDGNYNMAIHDPAVEAFPWKGTILALHVVRLLSVALGAVTVAMTYRLAEELFPERRAIWLGAASFTAFNPMFLFISGSVNNDNLSTAVASVLLVEVIRLLKRTDAPPIRTLVYIGVMAGAGMLAKFNIGFFLPLIALVLAVLAYRLRDWRMFVRGAVITGGLTIAIAGWWYVRNWQLYGDPTGLNVFLDIVGRRTIPANWAQLWSERDTFLMSYWGFFGGLNVPLPLWMYTVFNGIAAVGIVGCIVPTRKMSDSGTSRAIVVGRLITLLWIVVLFVGLLRWTSETWASQGRLMFAAIAPISLWMAVGLWRIGRWVPRLKTGLLVISGSWFAGASVIAAVLLIAAYRWPVFTITDAASIESGGSRFYETMPSTANQNYIAVGDSEDAQCPATFDVTVQVGEYATFCQLFSLPVAATLTRDWTVFVHLVNDDGLIVAQRDVYLGQGQLPTRLLSKAVRSQFKAGGTGMISLRNTFAIRIPDYAVAPQTLTAQLGFYDPRSGERMSVTDGDPEGMREIGRIHVQPRPSTLNAPNPMSVNFGDEAELVGYDISKLVMRQGDEVTVTLYWRGKRPLTTDYRVFVQILQPNTTNVFASHDGMPAEWTRPTSTWRPDEIIEDKHTFTIPADAPLDTWQLSVGMYQLVESSDGQQFRRLRVITPDGGMADDYVYLTRVKFVPK
ncbi:MAG: glycosyltransferase family 39 protein [Anaerolineae bacterium]|nr:glycosyltransferase family 39 protein [Anaerolineae bacterium]